MDLPELDLTDPAGDRPSCMPAKSPMPIQTLRATGLKCQELRVWKAIGAAVDSILGLRLHLTAFAFRVRRNADAIVLAFVLFLIAFGRLLPS